MGNNELLKRNRTFFMIGTCAALSMYIGYIKEYLLGNYTLGMTVGIIIGMILCNTIINVAYIKDRSSEKIKWIGMVSYMHTLCYRSSMCTN